jgi:hypothetical protein
MPHDGPAWLAPLGAEPGGVDFMGLRQPGLTMADTLLPGLTNTTQTVRYYTAIASWFRDAPGTHALRVLESAYVHACREHRHRGVAPVGVVGARTFGAAAAGDYPTGLGLSPAAVSALDSAFYGPSAVALGVVSRDLDGRYRRTEIGGELADTCGVDASGVDVAGPAPITRSLVTALGALCPCTPAVGPERDLLEEILFRLTRRRSGAFGENDDARRATLALVLHLAEDVTDPEPTLLQGMIDRLVGRIPDTVPEALRPQADGLGLLALRWHFRHAVESAWAAFGRLVFHERPYGAHAAPYVALIAAAGDGSPWRPRLTVPVRTVLDALPDNPGAELDAHRNLDATLDSDPTSCLLLAATQILAISRLVSRVDRSRVAHVRFLDLTEPWWCPLSALPREVVPGAPFAEWVSFILDRYVIGQHLLTAARKLADGVDGYFFYATEDGYRVDLARFGDGRRLRRQWRPDAGPTKLPSALAMLRDIGLLDEAAGRTRRTNRGTDTLARVLGDQSRAPK